MTLLKTESFDAISAIGQRCSGASGSIVTSPKRTGRAAWGNGGSGGTALKHVFPVADAHATLIMGFAMNHEAGSGHTTYITLSGDSNATNHMTVQINADGSANLRRGTTSGTIIATAPINTFHGSVWEHIQIKCTLSDTVGVFKLILNSDMANPVFDLTATDTKNAGTGVVLDGFNINEQGGGSPVVCVDDLWVCNGAGSEHNDFLGDLEIHCLLPNAEGDVIQFTPSTSTVHWSLVDEAPVTTTDYNTGTTDGHRDLLNFANLVPTSGTIIGITRCTYAAKVGTEVKYQRDVLRVGGVDYEGASKALSTGALYYETLYPKNPAPPGTAAWTIADINALQAGSVVKDT